jgi:hypothetical protein
MMQSTASSSYAASEKVHGSKDSVTTAGASSGSTVNATTATGGVNITAAASTATRRELTIGCMKIGGGAVTGRQSAAQSNKVSHCSFLLSREASFAV